MEIIDVNPFFFEKPEEYSRLINGGIQYVWKFDNGYGASVVHHDYSYNSYRGWWEIAVIDNISEDARKFNLCYTSGLTVDVESMPADEVGNFLTQIAYLPPVNQIENL